MAIVGDAFAKPMVRALEEAEADGKPYDLSSLQLIISSGVMWSAEVKQALMSRGNFICLDSLGSSEGVGFAGSISAPGCRAEDREVHDRRAREGVHRRRREVEPGSDEIGLLAVGGHIPVGYYKDEAKSAATFREIDGERWSVPGDFASVEADGSIVLLGRGSVVHQLRRREDVPRRGRGSGEAAPRGRRLPRRRRARRPLRRSGHRGRGARDRARRRPPRISVPRSKALARYKRPRRFVFVAEVERGPNGKADYKWAKANAADRQLT